jgi:hypothetical protein
MTVNSNTAQTYGFTTIREDLDETIYKISPTATPVFQALGREDAENTYTEWSVVELAAADATNKVVEGTTDPANDAKYAAVRLANYTQIMDKKAEVSTTAEAVDSAGGITKMAKQVMFHTQALKRDMEKRLCGNLPAVAGGASTARETAGIGCFMITNADRGATATAPTLSGTTTGYPNAAPGAGTPRAFTEDQMKDVIQLCWDQGGEPTMLVTGGFNRRMFSGFTGNAMKTVEVNTKKLVATVDVYSSDFGDLTIIADRFADPTQVLILDPETIKIAWLQTTKNVELARTGHATVRLISNEWAVKVGNQKANGIVADLTTS